MSAYNDIFTAAKEGTVEDVKYFVEQKSAGINTKDNDGWTPLHYAASGNSNIEVTKYIVSRGADIEAKSNTGKTPLYIAVQDGADIEVLNNLISQGANVNAGTNINVPIHVAAMKGNIKFVKALVSSGANVNAKGQGDMTPLHFAAVKGYIDIAEYLISNGADVNAKLSEEGGGFPPVYVAVMEGKTGMVEFLISKGADVNAKNHNDLTPLHCAAEMGNLEIAKILVSNGADINAKDKGGATPFNLAKHSGVPELFEYFSSAGIVQDMPLDKELSEIEAVVNELEGKIKSGEISAENLMRQIRELADENTLIAKMNAGDSNWIDAWKKDTIRLSRVDRINIARLNDLKNTHRDDLRVLKLVKRAAECFLKLNEISFSANEMIFTPDMRPQIRASNSEIMAGLRKTCSGLLAIDSDGKTQVKSAQMSPEERKKKKRVSWEISSIVLGCIVGGLLFPFLFPNIADSSGLPNALCAIIFCCIGARIANLSSDGEFALGCVGFIVGSVIGVLCVAIAPPFGSAIIGSSIGGLLGWEIGMLIIKANRNLN